ncbi:MAG: exopolysaccharide biosynthesis polyprenyl glycosylphosphotransferase [Bacteroidetes bacterium]|nr:exopolysaccharide biosynthesis polyprenyl glycosylphosphotransferase [Bacteroidota bacterium]
MLKRRWKQVFISVNIINDIFVFIISAVLCEALTPYLLNNGSTGIIRNDFLILFISTYLFFSSVEGIYRGSYNISVARYCFGAFKTLMQTSLVIITMMVFIKFYSIEREELVIFILISSILIFTSKVILKSLNHLMQDFGFGMQKSLVIDPIHFSKPLIERLINNPYLGYEIIGLVGKTTTEKTDLKYFKLSQLSEIVKTEKINTLFIPSTDLFLNGYKSLEPLTKKSSLKIKILSPNSELILRHSGIHDLVGVTMNEPYPENKFIKFKNILKRIFDFFGSLLLIIILSPVLIITSLAIIFESGYPVIYKQKRSSVKNGKIFDFYKFRSMIKNAEDERSELDNLNESSGLLFKIKKDPRVTNLGKIIRKFSIDELPQLINVLKGEMSLVGPRPFPIKDIDNLNFPEEFWDSINRRSTVKPGMTGLWQVYGRSEIKFDEMILLDLYYVENYSVLFDLEIIYQTIPVVVFGKGAW